MKHCQTRECVGTTHQGVLENIEHHETGVVTEKDKMDVEVEDKADVSLGDDVDENIPVPEKRLNPAR